MEYKKLSSSSSEDIILNVWYGGGVYLIKRKIL